MESQYLDDLAALNKDGSDFIRLLRVLTLSSRPRTSTLCEVRVFSLNRAPRYSALSYCRQPDDGMVMIDVRGSLKGKFQISHDLRSATRALHQHRRNDWFWIDAICINQLSNNEKNDQVPRMRSIYENAYAGFVWLGNAVPRAEIDPDAIAFLDEMIREEATLFPSPPGYMGLALTLKSARESTGPFARDAD